MKDTTLIDPERKDEGTFDRAASEYDRTFGSDPTTIRLRNELYSLISSLVPSGGRLLDLACGTGTDATALAGIGYAVTGIDQSPTMVSIAREKAGHVSGSRPEILLGRLEDLPQTLSGPFDLIYSNFGGLNCIPDLSSLAGRLNSLIAPGGYLLAVVMPRVSPWEILTGLAHARPGRAFRRFSSSPVATGRDLPQFPVAYHSPRSIGNVLGRQFELLQSRGLNIVTPPPGSSTFAPRYPSLFRTLSRIDSALGSLPVFRSMGDHCLVLLRQREVSHHDR